MAAAGHERTWPVDQYHYDAVTDLPPDAELMVTGERYPVQGFRVGPRAYGVQYHPEVSVAAFAAWVGHGQSTGELPPDLAVLTDVSANAVAQQAVADAHSAALRELASSATADRRPGERDTLSR
jgi:GMP synthase (glutamine-hydrolysing)